MHLTREEERILAGELGWAKARALEVIVKVGEAVGAEKLVKISHAHVSGASYMTIGEAGRRFLEELAKAGARVEVPTTVNPVSYDIEDPESIPYTRIDSKVLKGQQAIMKALESMGVKLTLTCTPYYLDELKRVVKQGEHVAWGESNAVAYANSVLGVWTNREGGPLALLAAIAGRTYYYGPHVPEWRRPVAAFRLSRYKPLDSAEAGVLGYIVAREHKSERPPLVDAWFGGEGPLKEFLAAIGTASNLAMAYIPGITPLEPGNEFEEVIDLSEEDLKREMERLAPPGKPEIIYIGCPHSSTHELRELLLALKSRGKPKVEIVVSISRGLFTKALKEGLVDALRSYRVRFIKDTCLIVSPFSKYGKDVVIATNSYKAYHYLSRKGVKVGIASIKDMVAMAL
ncbi:MAG: aconitase X [Desulfurococcales archaeon]|nr:aconitase X [Desulfurococcales archaeon]